MGEGWEELWEQQSIQSIEPRGECLRSSSNWRRSRSEPKRSTKWHSGRAMICEKSGKRSRRRRRRKRWIVCALTEIKSKKALGNSFFLKITANWRTDRQTNHLSTNQRASRKTDIGGKGQIETKKRRRWDGEMLFKGG